MTTSTMPKPTTVTYDWFEPAASVLVRLGGEAGERGRVRCPKHAIGPGNSPEPLEVWNDDNGKLALHCWSTRCVALHGVEYHTTWGRLLGLRVLSGVEKWQSIEREAAIERPEPVPEVAYCASEPTTSVRDIKNALIHGVFMSYVKDDGKKAKLAAQWYDDGLGKRRAYRTSLSCGGTLQEARFGGDIEQVKDGKTIALRICPWTTLQGAMRGTEYLRNTSVPTAFPTTFLTGSAEVPHPLRFTVVDVDYTPDADTDGKGDALRRTLYKRLAALGMPAFFSSSGHGCHALFATDGEPDPRKPIRLPDDDVSGCGVDVFQAGGSGRHVAIQYDKPMNGNAESIPVLRRFDVIAAINEAIEEVVHVRR